MVAAITSPPRTRQEELGQFLTAAPVADFMASMFGPLPRTMLLPCQKTGTRGLHVENRRTVLSFISQIAWESEVWIAEDPDHMIHFNSERFLGPYPYVMTARH